MFFGSITRNEDEKMDYQLLFREGIPLHLSLRCRRLNFGAVGYIPIVGKIAANVSPIDRKAVSPNKGTLAPILKWANAIGDAWVESTVRSYRKGVK